VGDVAGMGADLYESYVGSILATFAIGASAGSAGTECSAIAIAVCGVIFSLIGTFMFRTGEKASQRALLRYLRSGTYFAAALCAVACIPITYLIHARCQRRIGSVPDILFYAVWLPDERSAMSRSIIPQTPISQRGPRTVAETGPATTIIGGISLGMKSTAFPHHYRRGCVIVTSSVPAAR
jgi:K(+)-stimulated pyrophosphate-energized sodium pump